MTPDTPGSLEQPPLDAIAILQKLTQGHQDGLSAQEEQSVLPQKKLEAFPLPQPTPEQRSRIPSNWAEQTLRSLLEALSDGIVVINRDGLIVLVNQCTEALFGYTREELLGQPIEVLVPLDVRMKHVHHRNSYFAAPRGRAMGALLELHGMRRDGTIFPVEISLSPQETEHGLLVTAVIRDITRRKREEAKLRTLVENIPAVTFIAPLDESAPEFYVSPQIEALLGFTQKEWLEDPVLWHRQLHPQDKERWNHQFAPTCAAGKPFREIYRFIAKDGRVVWVHGAAQMVRNEEGEPIFLQGVAFDVTAIKEAEETLQRVNVELDRRVQERTEELARSMAELKEKTAELEQFASVCSHDLRQPLRTLINFPQRLAKNYQDQLDERGQELIHRTIAGAERMRQLIESLSHYSRVLRRDKKYTQVDCTAACADACSNLQAALEECQAELQVSELPTVQGNPQQLMLLFQNLLGNAIKFREPGRVPRVEVGSRPQANGWVVWVKDNGIGIETRYLRRIFGLGERLHGASKYEGFGFGLAICEKIVLDHGGRIWAESVLGQGSTFLFTLWAAPPAGAAENG